MLLTAFMLALVVNSFALKVYVYLVEKPSPECFEVMLIITETDATAEWVQASGNAIIGDCVTIVGTDDFITVKSS